jgi:hypothetical protein
MTANEISLNNFNKMNKMIKNESMFSFYLVILYLFLEYARPQNFVPYFQYLHLPAVTIAIIAISLFFYNKLTFGDAQTVIIILLLTEMVIHGPIAVNNYWAFQVFYTMVITFIGYMAIVHIVNTDEKYYKLVKYWLMIFIFLAIYGYLNANLNVLKRYRYGIGVGGFVGDANDFCMALNMILPFALFGIFSEKTVSGRLYYIFLTCLFLLVIIFSESRGGFIGLVSVVLYSWWRSNKKIILSLLLGVFLVFALMVAPPTYFDEIQSIRTEASDSNTSGTGAQRIYAWKLGWKMFQDNPVIGVGQGNYPWNVGKTEDELQVLWKTRSLSGRAAHSLYFTLLSELGVIGAALFVLMIFYSAKDLIFIEKTVKPGNKNLLKDDSKKIYYLALALEGSMIGFLTSSIFISTLYYPSFWILCGFILSLKKVVSIKYACINAASQKVINA